MTDTPYELNAGEHILWEGRTEPFHIIEGIEGYQAVFLWTICLCTLFLVTLIGIAGVLKEWAIILMLLCIGVWSALSPIMIWRKVRNQRYCITNRRVILIWPDGACCSMGMDRIQTLHTYDLSGERAVLTFADENCGEESLRLRERSAHPGIRFDSNGNELIRELVFYNISDSQGAINAVFDAIKESNAAP